MFLFVITQCLHDYELSRSFELPKFQFGVIGTRGFTYSGPQFLVLGRYVLTLCMVFSVLYFVCKGPIPNA